VGLRVPARSVGFRGMAGRPEPRRRRGRRGLAATSPAEARKEVLGEVGAGLGFRRGRALRVPTR
jgi:hypothetical protein